MAKQEALTIQGTVTESLASEKFLVKLETGSDVNAYLGGKLRRFNIRVVPGDHVTVELSPYDLTKGRIIYRER